MTDNTKRLEAIDDLLDLDETKVFLDRYLGPVTRMKEILDAQDKPSIEKKEEIWEIVSKDLGWYTEDDLR